MVGPGSLWLNDIEEAFTTSQFLKWLGLTAGLAIALGAPS